MVAEKIQAKISLGQFEITDEQTRRPFDVYFRQWLDTYVKAHCKERTHRLYEIAFRRYLLPAFGQKDIRTITREEVKKLAYGLLADGKARKTVAVTLAPLSEMFNHAIEDGHVPANPTLRLLRHARTEGGASQADYLTREELGLLPPDLPGAGSCALLTETLKALLVERKKETLRKGWGEVPEWVFPSEVGTSLDPRHFRSRVWRKALAAAGLRYVRIHDLRHTFASLLIQQGESLTYVKEQLGHHSIRITVDTYGHLVPGGNRQAVDKLDGLENTTIRNLSATSDTNGVANGAVSA